MDIECTMGGTKILFKPSTFELFKRYLDQLYNSIEFAGVTTKETDQEEIGLQVSLRYRVLTGQGMHYTVNIYNTTSTIMVNGKSELTFVNPDLSLIQQLIKD